MDHTEPLQAYIECPTDDVSAYIDGELAPKRVLAMDEHFAACAGCRDELNRQKKFLLHLDSSLRSDGHLKLPDDFARRVAINAETAVEGLRRSNERVNALFVSAGFLLFGLFALGAEAFGVIAMIGSIAEKIGAVGSFLGHLIYSTTLGVVVVLRSFTAASRLAEASVAVLSLTAVMFLLFGVLRRTLRVRRV